MAEVTIEYTESRKYSNMGMELCATERNDRSKMKE